MNTHEYFITYLTVIPLKSVVRNTLQENSRRYHRLFANPIYKISFEWHGKTTNFIFLTQQRNLEIITGTQNDSDISINYACGCLGNEKG
jgi:hypothetical protein